MTPRVFIVQEPMKKDPHSGEWVSMMDFRSARTYGDLVTVLDPRINVLSPEPVMDRILDKLSDYSNADHVLAVGDPIAIGMVVAVAAFKNHGKISMLKWDKEKKNYIRICFDLRERSVVDGNK